MKYRMVSKSPRLYLDLVSIESYQLDMCRVVRVWTIRLVDVSERQVPSAS